MAHNFDISKLTGRLQQLAYDADSDKSEHIDTEAEYSIFKDRAYVDCTEGALAKEDFKNIFGYEPSTGVVEEVVVPAKETTVPEAETNPETVTAPKTVTTPKTVITPVAVSKKEAKRDEAKIKDAVKDMVKQGVTPQEIMNELKSSYTNPQFASIINEVQEVLNIVNATNYNSKDDVKKIHDTAKKSLKAAGKWDGFHKDVLAALEDQAEANQIEKEFKVLLGKYKEVKTACDNKDLAPNFSEYVKIVKDEVKGQKSYTKEALDQLEDWARREAMSVAEDRLEASQATSKKKIRKELRDQNTAGDSYQNDAIQDLKTERKIFARRNKAEARGEALSHLNKESLISELGKRGYQYNFVKKVAAHKIGRNIYDKLKNKYLETIKNEDGTYDLSKLQDDLLNYVGQDYKVNQSKDEQMAEMFHIKVRLKDLTGEDFSDNETKVLLNALGFDREHKDHFPKLGKAIVNGIGGAIAGFTSVGEIRQSQNVTLTVEQNASKALMDQLDNAGVQYSTTELTKGKVEIQIFQEQVVRPGVINALRGAGIGVLTSAMLDIILGNKRDEKSCFSVSDYNVKDQTYTDPEKYKKHFANTTKNKAKSDAMNTLVDAYVEKYGENWHSELHNTILKTAGIGSKMNPEECRVLRFQKPEVETPVKPEPKKEPEKEPEPKPQCGVDIEKKEVETTKPYRRQGGDSWGKLVLAFYPCLVQEKGLSGAIRALKIALATDENGNINKRTFQALKQGSDLPKIMHLPAKIGDCKRVDDAKVTKVKIHVGGKAIIKEAGSKTKDTTYTATDGCDDRQKATGRTAKEAMTNLKKKTGKTYINEKDY